MICKLKHLMSSWLTHYLILFKKKYLYIACNVAGIGKGQIIKAISEFFLKQHSHDMLKVLAFIASVAVFVILCVLSLFFWIHLFIFVILCALFLFFWIHLLVFVILLLFVIYGSFFLCILPLLFSLFFIFVHFSLVVLI
jgi:hypothetical protein